MSFFFTDPSILMIYIYLILYIFLYIAYDICIKLDVYKYICKLLNYHDISIYYFNRNE